jgi:hypothetical protein
MQSHDHNIRIYTADAALKAEDAVLASQPNRATLVQNAINESSLAHFCAFVDFYTRKAADPFGTTSACEKQAEVVQLAPEDATPENMQMLMDTMLEAIDHLEKKWLDEQLKLEDRQRKHREDVARLYAQIRELQPEPRKRAPLHEKGAQWLHSLLFQSRKSAKRPHKLPKRRPVHIAA